jgi:hypothetical protein
LKLAGPQLVQVIDMLWMYRYSQSLIYLFY